MSKQSLHLLAEQGFSPVRGYHHYVAMARKNLRAHLQGDVVRYKTPGSTFPIAAAVEIPTDARTVYLSGKVPPVVDKSKPATDPAAYGGDTEGQTVAILKGLEDQLKGMNLGMSDVVKMQVFLKAPQGQNDMDFRGFSQSYLRFFDAKAGVKLPARSLLQTQGFANPGWLVEIDVIAARPAQNR